MLNFFRDTLSLFRVSLKILAMDHVSCKKIHNLKLQREGNDPFGFRIIGGVDQGKTFQVK